MSRHEILEYDRNNSEFLLGFLKVKKKAIWPNSMNLSFVVELPTADSRIKIH